MTQLARAFDSRRVGYELIGIGTLGAWAFSPGFLGVLAVAFATMLSMRLLRVTTPPVLAVAILPLVFGVGGLGYPTSILLATAVLFVLFRAEQRVLPAGGQRPPPGETG